MDKFSIESKIKDRLKNHSESIDTNELLDSMGLVEDDDKNRGTIWIIGGALFIISFLIYLFMTSLNVTNLNNIEESPNKSIINKPINNEIVDRTHEKETKEQQQHNISDLQPVATSNKINSVTENTSTNLSSTYDINTSSIDSPSSSEGIHILQVIKNTSLHYSNIDSSQYKKENYLKTISYPSFISNSIKDVESYTTISIPLLETTALSFLKKKKISCGLDYELTNQLTENNYSRWSILTSFGVSKFHKDYKVINNRDNNYKNFKKENENELEQFSFDLLGKYRWNKDWYIKGGLGYQRYNSKHYYKEYFEDSIHIVSYNNTHINYGGDTSSTTHTTNHSYVQRTWNLYNHHHLISIPVAIGYEHQNTSISWFMETELATSIYSWNKGKTINPSYAIEINTQNYKPRFILQANIAGGISYKVSPKTRLWISTKVGKSLNSITNSTYPLQEKYLSWGSNIGIEYQL